jgi:hypothetical protein
MKKNSAVAVINSEVESVRGRKYIPTKVDAERVKNLILLGLSEEEIAPCVGANGVSVNTLRDYYGDLITRYRKDLLGKIAAGAYRAALPVKDGGDKDIPPEIRSRMQIFVLKTRAGWREQDMTVINANQVQIVKRVVGVDEKDI